MPHPLPRAARDRFAVYHESCAELAGESPATVMTKQPCSWWAAAGETRTSKPHDNVTLGGKQSRGPYDEESCARVERSRKREPSLR